MCRKKNVTTSSRVTFIRVGEGISLLSSLYLFYGYILKGFTLLKLRTELSVTFHVTVKKFEICFTSRVKFILFLVVYQDQKSCQKFKY